ncbi:MAG: rhomboid family intramembrane serine protease [Gemmatimonadetes bacterium]|nr:rhomboid family intramembrane serine protease [Gemmatimonadota bacterium]
MFPLHDDNPTELFPVVTLGLLAGCAAVWVLVQGAGLAPDALRESVCALGAIPAEVTGRAGTWASGSCSPGGLAWGALVTSMFLHGSWLHLIGTLWFLWIFGNNVEDSMGHLRFVVFYLLTGVVAALAHVALDPASTVPLVGASGAISAVMGAYMVLYPRARVDTLFWIVVFVRVIPLPAWVILGYWFFIQVASTGAVGGGGGVAYAAHVGGFVAGALLIKVFEDPRLVSAKRRGVGLLPGNPGGRRWW